MAPLIDSKEQTAQWHRELKTLLSAATTDQKELKPGYLLAPDGRKILRLVTQLKLSWDEMEKRLQRTKKTIQKAFGRHNLSIPITQSDGADAQPKKMEALGVTFKSYVQNLISERMLREEGFEVVYEKVREDFAQTARDKGIPFNKKDFQELLDAMIWTKEVDGHLLKSIQHHLGIKDFHDSFPYIPDYMLKKRKKLYKGTSRTALQAGRTHPGFGRVSVPEHYGDLTKVALPETSFEKPFIIPTTGKKKPRSILFLNGANIGVRYAGDITENVPRRVLADACAKGVQAVILTNLVNLETKKAGGPNKVKRAMVMGDNVNLDNIRNKDYVRIVDEILKGTRTNQVIHQTTEEYFDNLLAGWKKIWLRPDSTPEYSGNSYVVLGIHEEDLIDAITYWEIAYLVKRRQIKLQAKLSMFKTAYRTAAKEMEKSFSINTEERERGLLAINEKIDSITQQLTAEIISTVVSEEFHKYEQRAKALVIKKIEEALPGAEVIGKNDTHIQFGKDEHTKTLINIPDHDKVTAELLANFTMSTGPTILREALAPNVVICHPYALQYKMTVRENDADGYRGSSRIYVAPIAIDDEYIRAALKERIRKAHPLMRTVKHATFESGVLRLAYSNGNVFSDALKTKNLEAYKQYDGRKNKKGVPLLYRQGPTYMWIMTGTDPHWGGRPKEFVFCKETGERYGMAEAVMYMLRRDGLCQGNKLPVHMYVANDDGVQAQNVDYRNMLHAKQRPLSMTLDEYYKVNQEAQSIQDSQAISQLYSELVHNLILDLQYRGSDNIMEQMEQLMDLHIKPNKDFFSAVLTRGQEAGLRAKGVGEFGKQIFNGYDKRNLGFIMCPEGNHVIRTTKGEMMEGPIYANRLKDILGQLSEWNEKTAFLEKAVVAASYNSAGLAWGTLRAPGGYEYGMDLRASPPRMSGWGDVLAGVVKNDITRGNYSRIFNNKFTIKTYGDKHFFAETTTSYAHYMMTASGTATDGYGERGFPPNNTGISFLGLPVDGPDSGPILARLFPYNYIRDIIEDEALPYPRWDEILVNAA